MATLGVVIYSLKGMERLPQCLDSVRWADLVLLLHAGAGAPSADLKTGASLVSRRLGSAAEIRELSKEITTDWVLHLWGEETVGGQLKEELQSLCNRAVTECPASYRIPIRSRLLECWVEGSLWGPSPSPRLRRDIGDLYAGWWNGVVEHAHGAPSGLLQGWIEDYSTAELSAGVDRINKVSSLWAKGLQEREMSLSPARMVAHPLQVFIRLLWLNGLYSQGFAGLTLSILAAYTTLLSGAKLWEARNFGATKIG